MSEAGSDPREEPCAAQPVPGAIAEAIEGRVWARDRVGMSGAAVYRLDGRPGTPSLYLKHAMGEAADEVGREAARLRWLADRIAVPAVHGFVARDGAAWLLTEALPGQTAYQLLEGNRADPAVIVAAIAGWLRRLHAIPLAQCPFDSGITLRLADARRRIDAGLVEEDDFDAERQGWTAAQVWDAMHALLPFSDDRVVTHGDFSLDNILIDERGAVACIDVARAGVADRYQDIAIAWHSLGEFGPVLQQRFLDAYGIAEPDQRKLDFHLMLDELF